MIQPCPMHMDETIEGTRDAESGEYAFTCPIATGHGESGPYHWLHDPNPTEVPTIPDLAVELGLDHALPKIIASYKGAWVEYGVLERDLAKLDPVAFASLVSSKGHTAIAPTKPGTSTSVFLGRTLNQLSKRGDFASRRELSTGRWKYNQHVTWCAIEPTGDWNDRISWASTGDSMDYVPGNNEH